MGSKRRSTTAASCSSGCGTRSRSRASTPTPRARGTRASSRSRTPELPGGRGFAPSQLTPRRSLEAHRLPHGSPVAAQDALVRELEAPEELVRHERPALRGPDQVAAKLKVL